MVLVAHATLLMNCVASWWLLCSVAAREEIAPGHAGLGPGLGPWVVEDPSEHGLSAANLKLAGERLAKMAPTRDCFVVVRDGVVVHDSYRTPEINNGTLLAIDSIGKTMTALVVGHAVHLGLLDIDRPLHKYIDPMPNVNWSTWWPNVTTRHLLSQTSGQGKYPPGTAFTYDSDQYIGHLSPLLKRVSGVSPREFAASFAAKIGLPHLYDYETTPPGALSKDEFTVGGGQPLTCRDIARVGQLILNKGRWNSGMANDAPVQLISEEWAASMSEPSVPEVASSYGFLTYNNRPPPSFPNCCSPRWSEPPWTGCPGYAFGHNRNILRGPYLGDDIVLRNKSEEAHTRWGEDAHTMNVTQGRVSDTPSEGQKLVPFAPADIIISVGSMAKYMFTIPSRDMVVVTMGQTWGSSSVCNVNLFPNYDEAMTGTVMWEAFGDLTLPHSASIGSNSKNGISDGASAEALPKRAVGGLGEDTEDEVRSGSETTTSDEGDGGACYCNCPPDRTSGKCYNVTSLPRNTKPSDHCAAYLPRGSAPGVCPGIGVVKECGSVGADDCSTNMTMTSGGQFRCDKPCIECTLAQSCADAAQGSAITAVSTCNCKITAFYSCEYEPEPCVSSPYFP